MKVKATKTRKVKKTKERLQIDFILDIYHNYFIIVLNIHSNKQSGEADICSKDHSHENVEDEIKGIVELEQSDEEQIAPQINLNHTERPHSYTCDRCLLR